MTARCPTASAVRGLESLERNPDKQAKYLEFVDIYARLDNNERIIFEQRYQKEANAMTGFVERYESIGKEKGQREALLATARNLILKTSMDNATIADLTGLPEADIQVLRECDAGR